MLYECEVQRKRLAAVLFHCCCTVSVQVRTRLDRVLSDCGDLPLVVAEGEPECPLLTGGPPPPLPPPRHGRAAPALLSSRPSAGTSQILSIYGTLYPFFVRLFDLFLAEVLLVLAEHEVVLHLGAAGDVLQDLELCEQLGRQPAAQPQPANPTGQTSTEVDFRLQSGKHASSACEQFLRKLWTFLDKQQIFGNS